MQTYQAWSETVPMEYIDAATSFEARKTFAAKHNLPVTECMSRPLSLGRIKQNRWRCQHCGTCGFGISIPPHDRPEGVSCRASGQKSEREIQRSFRPTIPEPK